MISTDIIQRILLLFSVSCAKFGSTAVSIPDEEGRRLQPASLTNSFNHVKAVSWTNSSANNLFIKRLKFNIKADSFSYYYYFFLNIGKNHNLNSPYCTISQVGHLNLHKYGPFSKLVLTFYTVFSVNCVQNKRSDNFAKCPIFLKLLDNFRCIFITLYTND